LVCTARVPASPATSARGAGRRRRAWESKRGALAGAQHWWPWIELRPVADARRLLKFFGACRRRGALTHVRALPVRLTDRVGADREWLSYQSIRHLHQSFERSSVPGEQAARVCSRSLQRGLQRLCSSPLAWPLQRQPLLLGRSKVSMPWLSHLLLLSCAGPGAGSLSTPLDR